MRRIIGIAEVCRATGRSRSSVRRYLNCPAIAFPQPVRLGPRDRGWFEDEINHWIEARPRTDGCNAETHGLREPTGHSPEDVHLGRETAR